VASVNTVILIGNVGRDPEVKHTQDSTPVANFSLATSKSWKGKDGEWQENTQWHRIVCWDKIAEQAGKLLKGQQVYVMGELEYRKYVPRGEDKEVTVAEIRASRIVSLVKREAAGTPSPNDGSEDDPSSLPF
jgi:single-strand DNA-binding protein